ncbi:hypothetical protein C7974DRAFT_393481 [Boeremia exigua]|uniref:uncharacterized protein n=1 Tax=Boeremia exigua TaxID=749465 RepID=UPI001E8EE9AC|nr:uncharacterized protein C7974DRAFT_393481 [Boeremia exigua]KAH6633791.1 hypothetical protein C7974DRAFT_393481 [Boeremia exigua]
MTKRSSLLIPWHGLPPELILQILTHVLHTTPFHPHPPLLPLLLTSKHTHTLALEALRNTTLPLHLSPSATPVPISPYLAPHVHSLHITLHLPALLSWEPLAPHTAAKSSPWSVLLTRPDSPAPEWQRALAHLSALTLTLEIGDLRSACGTFSGGSCLAGVRVEWFLAGARCGLRAAWCEVRIRGLRCGSFPAEGGRACWRRCGERLARGVEKLVRGEEVVVERRWRDRFGDAV